MTLPTDNEFCDQLYLNYHDPQWAEIWRQVMPLSIERFIDHSAQEELYTDDEIERMRDLIPNHSSPEKAYRGKYIESIRGFSLEVLGISESSLVKDIPVALLPTRELNACAVRTPRNGAVILIDSGVVFSVNLLCRYYLPLYAWYADYPDMKDSVWGGLAESIIYLARFCTTGKIEYLAEAGSFDCPGLLSQRIGEPTGMAALMLEVFILLHEYGHAALGHLDPNDVTTLSMNQQEELVIYNKSQLEEFEADRFAFERLCSFAGELDGAFFAGLILKFFGLCEQLAPTASNTHPPADARWKRIKELANVVSAPKSSAFGLDTTFIEIGEFAKNYNL